jgi:hypothetical protein
VTFGTTDEADRFESMRRQNQPRVGGKNILQEAIFIMNKLAIGLAFGAALAAQAANAGLHYSTPVVVGTSVAYGGVHSARTSADSKQFIGCAAYGAVYSSSTYVACSASNSAGKTLYCATYNPSFYVWQAAMSVNQASAIIFNVDSHGNCTYIYVGNSSTNL